ncbi:hypothetical protein ACI2OX_07250 [Bacillus sp. N9]
MTFIATAQSNQVEVFDISKGIVEKKVPLNEDIQQNTEKLLKRMTGVYQKMEAIPKKES